MVGATTALVSTCQWRHLREVLYPRCPRTAHNCKRFGVFSSLLLLHLRWKLQNPNVVLRRFAYNSKMKRKNQSEPLDSSIHAYMSNTASRSVISFTGSASLFDPTVDPVSPRGEASGCGVSNTLYRASKNTEVSYHNHFSCEEFGKRRAQRNDRYIRQPALSKSILAQVCTLGYYVRFRDRRVPHMLNRICFSALKFL